MSDWRRRPSVGASGSVVTLLHSNRATAVRRELASGTRPILAIVENIGRKLKVAETRVERTAQEVLANAIRGELLASSESP